MYFYFLFYDPATTEIYTLSLHDALPICKSQKDRPREVLSGRMEPSEAPRENHEDQNPYRPQHLVHEQGERRDPKSTRLNSSHGYISYAVFCLKKKKKLKHYRIYPPYTIQ